MTTPPRRGEDPSSRRGAVNLDLVASASIAAPVERVGVLSDDRMREMARDCAALEVATDCG